MYGTPHRKRKRMLYTFADLTHSKPTGAGFTNTCTKKYTFNSMTLSRHLPQPRHSLYTSSTRRKTLTLQSSINPTNYSLHFQNRTPTGTWKPTHMEWKPTHMEWKLTYMEWKLVEPKPTHEGRAARHSWAD